MLYLLDVVVFFFLKKKMFLVFFVVSCFCCWVVAFLMSFFFSRCPSCTVVVLLLPGEVRFRAGGVSLPLCSVSIATFSVYRLLPIVPSCMYSVYLSLIFFSFLFFPFRVVFSPLFSFFVFACLFSYDFMSLHCFRLFVARPVWLFPFMGSTCIYACVTALFSFDGSSAIRFRLLLLLDLVVISPRPLYGYHLLTVWCCACRFCSPYVL